MGELFKQPILLLGMPRSGTSWIGKIFDSHPDVLYRHEPDAKLRYPGLPYQPNTDELAQLEADARKYIFQLVNSNTLRASGSLPMFLKRYRTNASEYSRRALILSLRAASKAFPMWSKQIDNIAIPDGLVSQLDSHIVPVVKSVDSLARAKMFSLASPEVQIIHLIRHPCGFVSSIIQGRKRNQLASIEFTTSQAQLPQAKKHYLTLERLKALSIEEKLASWWMLINEKVIEEMKENDKYKLIIYDEVCSDPINYARKLFDFVGLGWNIQTEMFILRSLNYSGRSDRYFQVIRNPLISANKWKKNLDSNQQRKILELVRDSLPGKLFFS